MPLEKLPAQSVSFIVGYCYCNIDLLVLNNTHLKCTGLFADGEMVYLEETNSSHDMVDIKYLII